MSLLPLVILVAVVTVGSRILALAALPSPAGWLADLVQRMPAPLFAGLAVLSLTSADTGLTHPPLLVAVLCALLSSRMRSLLVTLAAGLAGYLLASIVL